MVEVGPTATVVEVSPSAVVEASPADMSPGQGGGHSLAAQLRELNEAKEEGLLVSAT